MKKFIQFALLFFLFGLMACAETKTANISTDNSLVEETKNDTLYRFCEDEMESETPYLQCGYANSQGDTVIELGKYLYCFDDFLVHYAVVLFKDTLDRKLMAIDRNEKIICTGLAEREELNSKVNVVFNRCRTVEDIGANISKCILADSASLVNLINHPDTQKKYRGTDGTVGFVSAWESEKEDVGKGEQEIMKITEGERIDFELRFL